jgi:Ca-activated chloride channel homolog
MSALSEDPECSEVLYNVGNAYYKKRQYADAVSNYEHSLLRSETKLKPKIYHNLGNAYYAQEKYQEAVESYKSALKIDDKDKATKYNLELAQKKLREQSEQQKKHQDQQSQDEKKNDKGKNQDKKEKSGDEDKQNQEKPGEKKPGSGNKDKGNNEKPQEAPPRPKKISKEAADEILRAIADRAKASTNRIKNAEVIPGGRVEKDW